MRRSATLHVIFHTGGYLINFALLSVLVDRFSYPRQLVQPVAIVVVALYLFAPFNLVVFRAVPLSRQET